MRLSLLMLLSLSISLFRFQRGQVIGPAKLWAPAMQNCRPWTPFPELVAGQRGHTWLLRTGGQDVPGWESSVGWWGFPFQVMGADPGRPDARRGEGWGVREQVRGGDEDQAMSGLRLTLLPLSHSTDVFICTSPTKMYKYCPYEKVSSAACLQPPLPFTPRVSGKGCWHSAHPGVG